VALSLFPFTAPAAMMSRLATGGVSLLHLAGGLAGLAVTAYLCVWIASRFFRADTLLSFAPMEWSRFWREWRAA
jgi:ABC-type Na+ efflux pump permease subunit